MRSPTCQVIRRSLGAFVDGELPGADMLRTASHLDVCEKCAQELESLREVGDMLRVSARLVPTPSMDGLADGLVARVLAEEAQSWHAKLQRGVDDWHWAIVGLGSVTATSLVAMFVAFVLAFGPAPFRSDSLTAVLSEQGTGRGPSYGYSVPPRIGGELALATFIGPSEQDVVHDLSEQFERFPDFQRMDDEERRYTEGLLDRIISIRASISQGLLMEHTTVTASGL